jgi:hypothetical protein
VDGEAVAFDPKRLVSSFQLLQNGSQPVVFAAFDCLYVDGKDLREQPLTARRTALEHAIEGAERIFAGQRLLSVGLAAYREAQRRRFEGMVGKDASSPTPRSTGDGPRRASELRASRLPHRQAETACRERWQRDIRTGERGWAAFIWEISAQLAGRGYHELQAADVRRTRPRTERTRLRGGRSLHTTTVER